MKKKLFLSLVLAFIFVLTVSSSVATAASVYQTSGSDCVIPTSGPWPPCATSGNGGGNTGGNCVIPTSGPWPPCATDGNGGGNNGGGNDCAIPASGPWPPCATDGNGGGHGGGGGGGDCVIPTSGPWPPCAGGNGGGGNDGGGNGGGGNTQTVEEAINSSVQDFEARCGILEYELQLFSESDVPLIAAELGISEDIVREFLVVFEVIEIPGAQGQTKSWNSNCWAISSAVMRNAAEQMGGLLDRVSNGEGGSCNEWINLYLFVELSPAYSGVPARYQEVHGKYLAARDGIEAASRDVSLFCFEGGTLSNFNRNRARAGINDALSILNPVTESEAWLAALLGL